MTDIEYKEWKVLCHAVMVNFKPNGRKENAMLRDLDLKPAVISKFKKDKYLTKKNTQAIYKWLTKFRLIK